MTLVERLREKREDLRPMVRRFKRNKPAVLGLIIAICFLVVAIFAPHLAPYDYRVQDLERRMEVPSSDHPFGTDRFGRDIFSRVIVGTRTSVYIGFTATVMVVLLGAVIGIGAGFFGGSIESVLMRITDIFMSIPSMFLMIVFVAVFGPSLFNTIIVIGLTRWTGIARLARANTMAIRNEDFVEAGLATGASDLRIILRHVLPNIMAPIVVQASLFLGQAILTEAGLSYLGLGAQPPLPSWGNMVSDGQDYLTVAWWQATIPGAAIFFAVLAFNLFGDGVRDALDPKMKR